MTEADQGIYDDGTFDCEAANNCFAVANGTSFASPFVAGGLAVIAEYFSGQLGATEIVQRMLSTANKTGVYADAEIYGQGLLDLDAATSPVGQLSATLSGTLDSVRIPWLGNSLNISNFALASSKRQLGSETRRRGCVAVLYMSSFVASSICLILYEDGGSSS